MEEKILIGRKGNEQKRSFLSPWQLNDLCINGKWIVHFGVIYDYDLAVEWSRKIGTVLRREYGF
jgi:hypothetical protein